MMNFVRIGLDVVTMISDILDVDNFFIYVNNQLGLVIRNCAPIQSNHDFVPLTGALPNYILLAF